MTTCNRCGVELKGNDKRETSQHCGKKKKKLGLKPDNEYCKMNVITDPTNATGFIIIGILIIIGGVITFASTGQLELYYEGRNTDEKITDTVKNIDLTDENCEKLKDLRYSIRGNSYSHDSVKMIDAKLLECEFKEVFPNVELKKVSNRK